MVITETFLHEWTGEVAEPLRLVENHVKPEWVDEYQHLNMAQYLTICDQANWAFWNWLNHPAQTIESRKGHEYVIVENHVIYIGELAEGANFVIDTILTDIDDKRFILFHHIYDADGNLAATNEVKCLGFNLESRRIEAWQPVVAERMKLVLERQIHLARPEQSGQGIVLKKR
ncbi:thioesterase family protein [Pararhizobium sp. YC-54]|uniref:thioesterase family protein n=1 Tax=Pararhizobium sp. YC-54 TaxID=2986920 RepID=UPI0021F6FD97|nr:thioesterase family protein [Pararhizobium sp. YC-54]MCW0001757.1 thioesterase family protein [Pararhizobium sp. YC-54]